MFGILVSMLPCYPCNSTRCLTGPLTHPASPLSIRLPLFLGHPAPPGPPHSPSASVETPHYHLLYQVDHGPRVHKERGHDNEYVRQRGVILHLVVPRFADDEPVGVSERPVVSYEVFVRRPDEYAVP